MADKTQLYAGATSVIVHKDHVTPVTLAKVITGEVKWLVTCYLDMAVGNLDKLAISTSRCFASWFLRRVIVSR